MNKAPELIPTDCWDVGLLRYRLSRGCSVTKDEQSTMCTKVALFYTIFLGRPGMGCKTMTWFGSQDHILLNGSQLAKMKKSIPDMSLP